MLTGCILYSRKCHKNAELKLGNKEEQQNHELNDMDLVTRDKIIEFKTGIKCTIELTWITSK